MSDLLESQHAIVYRKISNDILFLSTDSGSLYLPTTPVAIPSHPYRPNTFEGLLTHLTDDLRISLQNTHLNLGELALETQHGVRIHNFYGFVAQLRTSVFSRYWNERSTWVHQAQLMMQPGVSPVIARFIRENLESFR